MVGKIHRHHITRQEAKSMFFNQKRFQRTCSVDWHTHKNRYFSISWKIHFFHTSLHLTYFFPAQLKVFFATLYVKFFPHSQTYNYYSFFPSFYYQKSIDFPHFSLKICTFLVFLMKFVHSVHFLWKAQDSYLYSEICTSASTDNHSIFAEINESHPTL